MLQNQLHSDKSLFLIPHNCSIKEMPDLIVDAPYNSLHSAFFSSRFRGTKIIREDSQTSIVAWQRNVARLQKMDVSLPTIVTLSMDHNLTIQDINLHNSFAGSQGLCCSYAYLQRRLKNLLKGKLFSMENLKLLSAKNLQCFHLHEVLQAAVSFLEQNKANSQLEIDEVETITVVEEMDNIKFIDVHGDCLGSFLRWEVTFFDYKNKLQFGKNGELKKINNLELLFTLSPYDKNEIYFSKTINAQTNAEAISSLIDFTKSCWKNIADQWQLNENIFYNTNAVPSSFIGLIIQIIGTIIFSNNYNYFQHILGALQRNEDIPLCIGIMKDLKEAKTFFPDFNQNDLY